jgi:hypothetical protein
VGQSIEWTFAACVDLEESAARTCLASTLGPIRPYNEDELERVGKGRRKMSVIQKVWDHYVARTKLAGLLSGL